MDDYPETKGERRERQREKRHKMKVSGASVRNLQRIIVDKADKAKKRQNGDDDDD